MKVTESELMTRVEEEIKKDKRYHTLSKLIENTCETEEQIRAARNVMISGILATNSKIKELYLQAI